MALRKTNWLRCGRWPIRQPWWNWHSSQCVCYWAPHRIQTRRPTGRPFGRFFKRTVSYRPLSISIHHQSRTQFSKSVEKKTLHFPFILYVSINAKQEPGRIYAHVLLSISVNNVCVWLIQNLTRWARNQFFFCFFFYSSHNVCWTIFSVFFIRTNHPIFASHQCPQTNTHRWSINTSGQMWMAGLWTMRSCTASCKC